MMVAMAVQIDGILMEVPKYPTIYIRKAWICGS